MLKTILTALFAVTAFAHGLTRQEINEIKSGFQERKLQIIHAQIESPDPAYQDRKDMPFKYAFNRFNYALACLYANQNVEAANAALVDGLAEITKEGNEKYYLGEQGLHWHGSVLARTYLLFNDDQYIQRRLDEKASSAFLEVLWKWASLHSKLKDTEYRQSQTWYIWESENHDIMHRSLCWMAAKIFSGSPLYKNKRYADGSSAAEQYQKWTEYFTHYLSQRGQKGLFAEVDSPGYAKHTLQCLYNLYDFSEKDSKLKDLARAILDLWWADWAVEQFDSFRGGSKLRAYRTGENYSLGPCQNMRYQSGRLFSWIYTGIGETASRNSCVMSAATSEYMIPDIVIDMMLDVQSRGEYEVLSRRPAAIIQPRPETLGGYSMKYGGDDNNTRYYALNGENNGKLRYTYCTPEFIMGCDMSAKLPYNDWYAWGQNMWAGILFRGSCDSVIYIEALSSQENSSYYSRTTYNQHWGVQSKNTMILQRNQYNRHATDMRVWFADSLKYTEQSGWILVEAQDAFAAVKVVFGGYSWDDKNWLRLKDKDSPIIFEAISRKKYKDFESFKADVLDNKLIIQGVASSESQPHKDFELRNDILYYEGLQDSGKFTFYFRSDRLPEIDGVPVDLSPDFTFRSPFINQQPYGSKEVVIKKGRRKLVLDFGI